jgi:hypothetical protein
MRTLVDIATPEEQRALIRQVLEQVWIEKREVKKVKPTSAYSALLKAVNDTCGFMGCPTGDRDALATSIGATRLWRRDRTSLEG